MSKLHKSNIPAKTGVWVFLILIVFGFFPMLIAQEKKPKQLRKEILESKEKEDKQTEVINLNRRSGIDQKTRGKELKPANPAQLNRKATLIKLEHANEMSYDHAIAPDIQRLRGNVRFRQDGTLLYCDSAYFDEEANSFSAYSNVRIVQGDTVTIYGDFLIYNGDTRMGQLWDNVKMVHRNTTLTTDIMYYDRNVNLAFYDTGGKVIDGHNELVSIWGQYSPDTKIALFKDKVKMTNPDMTMTTDTLKYNTDNSVADIVGNSLIVHKDETDIYSERGWYDTKGERMMLLDRSLVEHNDGKTLTGDTIFYDKMARYGEAFSDVELVDPENKTTLTGNYVSYNELSEVGLATDSALLIDWSTKDSLFLSADTLYTYNDSTETDSIGYNAVKAFKNVRFYRNDIQGVCDSLYYTSRDSVMHLRKMPVIWSDNNQLKGREISAYIEDGEVRKVVITHAAIAIQHDSLKYYNQLSGKEIIAHVDSGALRKLDINGNVETIYFPKDEQTREYVGVNKTLSSFATGYFKDEQIERIVLTTASSGAMYPLSQMGENDIYLRDFFWFGEHRPLSVADLFKKFERTEPPRRAISEKRPAMPGGMSGDDERDDQRATPADSGRDQRRGGAFEGGGAPVRGMGGGSGGTGPDRRLR